jgi:hypothetical protein
MFSGKVQKINILIFSIFIIFSLFPTCLSAVPQQIIDAKTVPVIPDHTVKVIYFYPSDYKFDRRYTKAIDPFIDDVRDWYKTVLGVTFYAEPMKIVKGKLKAADYGPASDVWINVYRELGVDCGNNTVTLIFLARTLQHANGRSCGPWYAASDNGDVTLSEEIFDAEIVALKKGYCPNGFPLGDWRCSPAASRGAVAHELGHAFSLAHPEGCDTYGYDYCGKTVMWSWWLWPNIGFINESFAPEISTLRMSPWFY